MPQGSTLGPLLFVIFINDLSNAVINSKIAMYADDIVVYMSCVTIVEAKTKLQEDLDRINTWCRDNYMTINENKSMCMYFGTKAKIGNLAGPDMKLGDTILPNCISYPYLGVELDSSLCISPHITKLKKSLGNRVYKLSKLRKCMTRDICVNVYKVMISPIIEYCSFYTGSGQVNELSKLQRMQNQALRVCCRSRLRDKSIHDLHIECKVETLESRRAKQLLCIMWKRASKGDAVERANVRTRGDLKLKFAIRRAKTGSPYYRGVKLWDKLDHTIQKLPTKKRFKLAIAKMQLV